LGDVLGEWPVGNDPAKQFAFNGNHEDSIKSE
jgi:hypothetical protein